MKSMRAQVSLQFDDSDLFNNFIIPYKEGRLLNSLIIKCLSAYYYNESLREAIDGDNYTSAEQVEDKTTQTICENIRNTLMMQDFIAQELENTISNGASSISDILASTNSVLNKVQNTDTEGDFSTTSTPKQITAKPSEIDEIKQSISNLSEIVMSLARRVGDNQAVQTLGGSPIAPVDTFSTVTQQSVMQTPSTHVPNTFSTVSENFTASSSNIVSSPEVTVEEIIEEEDASGAIADLLSSIEF